LKKKLYENMLLSIFRGAVAEGNLREVPPNADSVLEMADSL
jgi:hypothetical protein